MRVIPRRRAASAVVLSLVLAGTVAPAVGADGEAPAQPAPVPGASPAPVDPAAAPGVGGASPPAPVLDQATVLHLLAIRREVSVATTRAAVDASVAVARTVLAAARTRLEQATTSLPALEATVEGTGDALHVAHAGLVRLEERIAAVVSESFQLSNTTSDALASDPLSLLDGGDRFAERSNSAAFGEVAIRNLRRQLDEGRLEADAADGAHRGALEALVAAQAEQASAAVAVSVAEADLQRVAAEGAAAVERARMSGEVEPVGDDGPSIMGPSVVSAADLAAFVQARGRPHPSIDLLELARAYLGEGEDEGVRGDIAFVQAILETGWYSFQSSMVDPEDHNYAGIGACDSCQDGFGYPTVELGVRAQIQLLAAYAQPGLTSLDYAHPPVRTLPERLGVRGCCGTWMALSGVWATGPGYGQKILKLYNELLAFAVARSAAG
jgi:hypothetical protein